MVSQKWNSEEICRFLEIYEQFELLWNIRTADYVNKHKREIALEKLLHVLAEKGLGRFNVEQLRKKIKSIRTVYRMELLKIFKSQNESPGNVYKPKLVWFKKAHKFLQSVIVTNDDANVTLTSDPLHFETIIKEESTDDTLDDEDTAMDTLQEETNSLPAVTKTEDEFAVFARHVATQLRQLPLVNAIRLEGEIQKMITTERIAALTGTINVKIENE